MKTTFYIVRHGQTLFNIKHLFQGWCDSPLLENGIQQAIDLGIGLKDIHFDQAICSTTGRTIDTLKYILDGRELPITYDPGLREVHFGDLEGENYLEKRPDAKQDQLGYAYCNGENREDAALRFMNTMKQYADGGTVLVISHASVIGRMLQMIDPYYATITDIPSSFVPNCSVTIVEYDQEFHLVQKPDISYRTR